MDKRDIFRRVGRTATSLRSHFEACMFLLRKPHIGGGNRNDAQTGELEVSGR